MMSSLLDLIGNTPVVLLQHYSSDRVKILAKLEGNNPGGSVKDRIALSMVQDAERRGLLCGEREILEATSGNTGIGMAMVCALKGYKLTVVMPESASEERKRLIKGYGAQIIYTDGARGTNYAIEVAARMKKEEPDRYITLDQFSNMANVQAHYEHTGAEIIRDVPEITHFVAGMGTGGTLMGAGRRLKEFNPHIQVIGVEPRHLSKIQGLRHMEEFTPPIYHENQLDRKLSIVDDQIAFDLAAELFRTEGICAGMSCGAALWGALEVQKEIDEGIIVTVFPDRGERYLSSPLFLKLES